ncbi:MAG: SagB/ThcOx family dehydrogenase [Planctomycetes bacterium]|nr:SagB/ThcOx family dehydrogenase [Planctomycetota bacterium]
MPISRRYHEATKYRMETIASHPGLDWSSQPRPWKEFHSESRVELAEALLVGRDDDDGRPVLRRQGGGFGLAELSTLLLHTNGATAVTRDAARPVYFRAAPSAGALYPTEIYLFLRDFEEIEDGLYNYQIRDHSLAPVLEGDFGRDLAALTGRHPEIIRSRCVLLFSAVFFRSAWRYHERAYRRILLDTGHVLGNLVSFAPELGLRASLVGAFADEGLDDLLLLSRAEESVLALAAITEDGPGLAQVGRSDVEPSGGAAMLDLHRAAAIRQVVESVRPPLEALPLPVAGAQAVVRLPPPRAERRDSLCTTILSRRSTRRFSGEGMTREQLSDLLGQAYAPQRRLATEGRCEYFDPARLRTWLSIHEVEGLDAGLYRYDPVAHVLLLIRRGRHEAEDHHVALGQDLARQAAVVIYHSADLVETEAALGARGYRFLGLDAGHIGQRLNLDALALGLGASGIGGYFDDEVNALFGMGPNEAIIYMTCIGVSAD